MAKKKTRVIEETATPEAAATTETTAASVEQQPGEPEPAPKRGRKKKGADAATDRSRATVQDAFAGYLDALEKDGASAGTCFSYKQELALAGNEFGLETRLADLTPERVLQFLTSDRVMKTRTGREKAPPTFLKTRRVVRQALVWAEQAKLVAKAPLPEELATH